MLRRITALNYRCLRFVDQAVGPFQVLVGPNGSGKSAFLDVVQFISDLLAYGLREAVLEEPYGGLSPRATRVEELIFHQVSDRFELAIELTIPEELRGEWVLGDDAWARYEVAVGAETPNGEVAILGETLWRCSGRPPPPHVARKEPTLFPVEPAAPETILLGARRRRAPSGWRKIASKAMGGNDYFLSETGRWNNVFRIGPYRSAVANLPEDREKFPVGLWLRDVLRQGVFALALDTDAMRTPVGPSLPRAFDPDGSNLPLALRQLRQDNRESFESWLGHVQTVLDDVQDIDVLERPEDNHAYMVVRHKSGGAPVPSWLLSDGTLRFLALTVLPYLGIEGAMYLIEEPENGIHPRAVDAVFDSLSSVYEGHVSVATHSPLILSLAAKRREQILCFAKSPSGATGIVRGDQHPALADWTGQPDLSVLYAAGVLG